MLNYNPEGSDISTSLGITTERNDELTNAMTDIAQEMFKKAMLNGGASTNDLLEKVVIIPQTPEESFMMGMYTMRLISSLNSVGESETI